MRTPLATRLGLGLGLVVVLVGCGDNLAGPVDGAVVADAPATDAAPIDAVRPDAQRFTGRFVVDSVDVPTTTNEAMALGLDLDATEPGGDPGVDNQLGNVLAAVVGAGFDVEAGVAFAIDHGDSITLLDFRIDGTLATYAGTAPIPPACMSPSDPICRQHLTGSASFDRNPTAATGSMPFSISGLDVTGGPGTAVVDITLLGSPQPLQLELIGARFVGSVDPTEVRPARLAGAVTATQIDQDVIPAVANAFRVQVGIDCTGAPPPGCGCAVSSNGAVLISVFDADNDCTISDDEVRTSSLIMSLLAPDVMIGGVPGVSFGIGVTAVPATFRFTPP